MTGWIFQATPRDFDIDAFLAQRPAGAKWRASAQGIKDRIRLGDRVFVWRAKGDGAPGIAGVVAEGAVAGLVLEQADDSAAARFWLDKAAARLAEPRVEIVLTRYTSPGELVPRDELKNDPVVGSTAIMKAGTGTNFALSDNQEKRLVRLWTEGRRRWSHEDLVAALSFYGKPDPVGLAITQGRYVSDARRALAAFQDCDPKLARHSTCPKVEFASAWEEVFGSGLNGAAASISA